MTALRPSWAVVVWCAGLVAAARIAATVDPSDYADGRARDDEDRLRRNSSAIAVMLGEFRTGMSDIMFLKTERYLHAGVGYRPHHDESVLSAGDLAEEVEEHQSELTVRLTDGDPVAEDEDVAEGEHADVPTLIPEAHRDFRGFIGRLHREVKPWRDPAKRHLHTDGRELAPWFRLMTRTDPRYVRGYVAGAFWLQTLDVDAALRFIEEGLSHNPDAFSLLVSRALITLQQTRRSGDGNGVSDVPAVRDALGRARADFERAAELALAQRPAAVLESGDPWQPGWSAYLEDDAARACHMAVLLARNLGDPERARVLAERYSRHFPDYAPLIGALRAAD